MRKLGHCGEPAFAPKPEHCHGNVYRVVDRRTRGRYEQIFEFVAEVALGVGVVCLTWARDVGS